MEGDLKINSDYEPESEVKTDSESVEFLFSESEEMDLDSKQSDDEGDDLLEQVVEARWSRLLDLWSREGVPRDLSFSRLLRVLQSDEIGRREGAPGFQTPPRAIPGDRRAEHQVLLERAPGGGNLRRIQRIERGPESEEVARTLHF